MTAMTVTYEHRYTEDASAMLSVMAGMIKSVMLSMIVRLC